MLAACDGSRSQQWQYLQFARLRNLRTGTCLKAGPAGTATAAAPCSIVNPGQFWVLPAGPVVSGAHALCLDSQGNRPGPDTAVTVAVCSGTAGQRFRFAGGILGPVSGLCLTAAGRLVGGRVILATCHASQLAQVWLPDRAGQLINIATGLCLSDPAAGGPGTALDQEDCYGAPGQVWGVN